MHRDLLERNRPNHVDADAHADIRCGANVDPLAFAQATSEVRIDEVNAPCEVVDRTHANNQVARAITIATTERTAAPRRTHLPADRHLSTWRSVYRKSRSHYHAHAARVDVATWQRGTRIP